MTADTIRYYVQTILFIEDELQLDKVSYCKKDLVSMQKHLGSATLKTFKSNGDHQMNFSKVITFPRGDN